MESKGGSDSNWKTEAVSTSPTTVGEKKREDQKIAIIASFLAMLE